MSPDVIDKTIEAIADDGPIDWRALDSGAHSGAARAELKWLRVLRAVSDVHRSIHTADTAAASTCSSIESRPGDADDLTGEWGRYRLIEEIGTGSYGRVYRAWDPELERELAIKILHRHVADARLRERLLREARALARVTHENVVRVLGVESHGDRVGLCMEFVSGETLEAVLRSHGVLNAREATLVGEDVCRALAAVHRAGFVHRDVNARNVMREQAGRTVLMDFGTGYQLEGGRTPEGIEVAGTPLYMAPEILSGHAASTRSDVYGVGVLLYHLVTGSYPVEGHTLEALVDAHAKARHRALSERRADLPLPFIAVVSRALAADPGDRWPSAGALLEALGGTARPEPQTRMRSMLAGFLVTAGIVLALTALGVLNSRYFNATLGRADFANETLSDWFYWGAVSSVAPAVLLMMALVVLAVLQVFHRLLLGMSATARALESRLGDSARRLRLDDVSTLSSCALLASVLVLTATSWHFSPLISALVGIYPDVSTSPIESLGFLSPRHSGYHETYRASFVWVTMICVSLWIPVFRLANRRGEPIHRGVLLGGAAIWVLSVALLDLPYRLLYHAEFESATWRGTSCYILGERADDYLLFCPELPPPRNRSVATSDPRLEHNGTRENIFSHTSIAKVSWP